MKQHGGYVYIMADHAMGTLCVGVTSNLEQRVCEHKAGRFPDSFTDRYDLHKLVYYECYDDIESAIAREKRLKHWNRNWKLRLIIDQNPDWLDLYEEAFK
ncbi:MAG: GIY-YIG nuclease family protein [Proteobacteria bacterium]|nr:GIY-YIG nuclease family protein [Pseudomonadota bacterium]